MATKNEWRDRIIQGPPFSNSERQGILDYCAGDVEMLAQLLPRLVPTIKSFPHAMQRAKFVWATAKHEHRGIPVNLSHIEQVRGRWQDIKVDLVREMDAPYGCYEIVDGQAHWRDALFAAYLTRTQIPWPRLDSGALDTKQNTFSDMAKGYAVLEDLSDLQTDRERGSRPQARRWVHLGADQPRQPFSRCRNSCLCRCFYARRDAHD